MNLVKQSINRDQKLVDHKKQNKVAVEVVLPKMM